MSSSARSHPVRTSAFRLIHLPALAPCLCPEWLDGWIRESAFWEHPPADTARNKATMDREATYLALDCVKPTILITGCIMLSCRNLGVCVSFPSATWSDPDPTSGTV